MTCSESILTGAQTCTATLAIRHMSIGQKPITSLNDLRGPMPKKLNKIQRQLKELARYKALFGALDGAVSDSDTEEVVIEEVDEEDDVEEVDEEEEEADSGN